MGLVQKIQLGNLEIYRDWGWGPKYVKTMWLMIQQKEPDDFVIAAGRMVSLNYFVAKAFEYFDLDWQRSVEINPAFFAPMKLSIALVIRNALSNYSNGQNQLVLMV